MCMVVFAASGEPMPIIPPGDSFLFQAQPLLGESEPVRRLFSKPYVYDLTSVGGCACGFSYGPYDLQVLSNPDVPDEVENNEMANHEVSRESIRLLRKFLRQTATRPRSAAATGGRPAATKPPWAGATRTQGRFLGLGPQRE